MKLNKQVTQSIAVLSMLSVLMVTAVTSNGKVATQDATEEYVIANTGLEGYGDAGIAEVLKDYEQAAMGNLAIASIKKENVNIVSASSESEQSEEEEWQNYLMPNVEKSLNVRAEANGNSAIVGKLYKGARATVIERGDEWTKISSGNLEGYVLNSYCLFGTDALAYAKANCDIIATNYADGLRIRKEPSTESGVVKTLAKGEAIIVDKNVVSDGEWIAVICDSKTCYVSADFVELSILVGKGITIEEEKAAQAEAARKKAKSGSGGSGSSSGRTLAQTVDQVTLLAALIQCEAGGESYECQLAVGAVVINRMKSSIYPNDMYSVIFQRGQFGPARTGKLERRLQLGVSSTAYSAAQAALSGQDNTNGAMYFKLTSSGHPGIAIGALVFY